MVASLDSYPGHVACGSQCHYFRGVDGCTLIQPEWHAPDTSPLCVWWGRSACLDVRELYVSPTDGWLANGTRNDRLRSGRILLCSAICVSPRCKSRRALSPCTKTFSTTTTSSATVLTPVPHLCLCRGRLPLPPIDLCLPKFADKDLIPSRLQSMWVATQEYPASPVSSASQSLCLDLDAISSEDSDAKSGDALSVSPITVISVDSSDSDPDWKIPPPARHLCPVLLLRPATRFVWWSLPRTT